MDLVDLSAWNQIVDFNRFRQARRGVVGLYQRTQEWRQAGTGTDEFGQSRVANGGLLDVMADRNLYEARIQGYLTGVYHRAYPSLNSPEQEALEFTQRIRQLDQYQKGHLWPMIDVEENRPLNGWIESFFDAYDDLTPVRALMFYASNSMFKDYYKQATEHPFPMGDFQYGVCIAHTERYSVPTGLTAEQWAGKVPLTYFEDKTIPKLHQYTHSATTAGVEGKHDLMTFLPDSLVKDVII